MVKFGGRIGVEDCLLAVPVALGDVSNVQNARCVTTTLDLDEISPGHQCPCSERLLRYPAPSLFAYQRLTPVQNWSRASILRRIP